MKRETFDRLFPLSKGAASVSGPMIAADHLAHLLERPLSDICRNGELLAEGFLKAQQLYHSDFIIIFADVSVEAEAMGVKLEYLPDRNPQPVRQIAWEEISRVDMAVGGRLPELFAAAEICRQALSDDFTIFFSMKDPFSLAAMTLGTESFLEKLLLDPFAVERVLEICCINQQFLMAAILRARFIPFVGAPIASGGLIGKLNFRRFAQPYLQRLFGMATDNGSFGCLHICGEIEMLGSELADLKLDLLSFEDWHEEIWAQLPETIPMGFIPTDLFIKGSVESVREATRMCGSAMPQPYVLSTGCDLPANADPKLVQVMMTH